MEQEINSERLRNTARFVEESVLDALADFSEVSFPLVRGGARDFPRLAPEGLAAEQGVDILREDAEETVAALHALAAASDNEIPISPALLASVRPFIDAFDAEGGRPTSESSSNQTEGNTPDSDEASS